MSRRKDPHLLALAVRSDWKFSAALAVFALVFGFVFIPWFIAPLAFAGAIAGVLQKVSAGAAILFGLIALARFFFPGSRNSRTQGARDKPVAIVQCKSWIGNVGIKPIRELAGVMAHEKVSKGHFFTTAGFSDEAVKFASQNRINLVSGEALLAAIRMMSDAKQAELLQIATEGDYLTPTCASCGIKLLVRTGKQGEFWGCSNFPRCRTTMKLRGMAVG